MAVIKYIKNKVIFKDKSNIYSLLTSIISVTSGLVGFNMAFIQDKELAPLYIYSLSVSFLFQIISSSVLNYKKSAILTRFKYQFNIRNSIMQFLFLNTIIVLGSFAFFDFLTHEVVNKLMLLILLQLVFSYMQVITFNNSIFHQLKNLEIFLKVNFVASIIRGLLIFILLFYFELSFWSLVLANIASAFTISLLYGIKLKQLRVNYGLGLKRIRYVSNIFKLEGYLRSYRMYSEPWLLTLLISLLNIFKLLKPSEMDMLNFAMPYLNSISNQFRQLFIKFERSAYTGTLSKFKFSITYLPFLLFVCVFLFRDIIMSLSKIYFPASSSLFLDSNFLLLIALQLLILPLTLGYSYIDYAKKSKYYKFLTYATVTLIALVLSVLFVYKFFFFDLIFIALPLLYIISIALNKKKLVE